MRDLLYHINEHSKTVTFTIVRDNEDLKDAIENDNTIILSFEDIIKNVEELKLDFQRYEDTASRITELISKAEKPFMNEVDELKNSSIYNTNLFAHYYSNIIRNNAFAERKTINNSIFHFFTFRSIINNSKSNMYSLVNCIKDTMFTDWNIKNTDVNAHSFIKYGRDTIVHKNGNNIEEYIVADAALFNFFFDFNKALNKEQDENIINCSSYDNDFYENNTGYDVFVESSSECNHCKQIDCQTFLLIPRKRKKRAKNDSCKKPVNTIQDTFRQKTFKLRKSFPDNNKPVAELLKYKKSVIKKIKDIVLDYEIENRSTNCPEMEKTLGEIRNDINQKYTNIKLKYEKMD